MAEFLQALERGRAGWWCVGEPVLPGSSGHVLVKLWASCRSLNFEGTES